LRVLCPPVPASSVQVFDLHGQIEIGIG
jgi:hypothetical protein